MSPNFSRRARSSWILAWTKASASRVRCSARSERSARDHSRPSPAMPPGVEERGAEVAVLARGGGGLGEGAHAPAEVDPASQSAVEKARAKLATSPRPECRRRRSQSEPGLISRRPVPPTPTRTAPSSRCAGARTSQSALQRRVGRRGRPAARWRGPRLRRRGRRGSARARPSGAVGAARRDCPWPGRAGPTRSAPASRRGRAWAAARGDRRTRARVPGAADLAVARPSSSPSRSRSRWPRKSWTPEAMDRATSSW